MSILSKIIAALVAAGAEYVATYDCDNGIRAVNAWNQTRQILVWYTDDGRCTIGGDRVVLNDAIENATINQMLFGAKAVLDRLIKVSPIRSMSGELKGFTSVDWKYCF